MMHHKYSTFALILIGMAAGFGMVAGMEQVTPPPIAYQLGIVALWIPLLLVPFFRTKQGALLLGLLGVTALGFEALSIATGFPYSHFTYNDVFGYKLGGLVPWTVFFGWTPLVIATTSIARQAFHRPLSIILFSSMLLVLFDLVFDPVVTALGFWEWDMSGHYYGVPLQNFFGWLLSGSVGSLLTYRVYTGKRSVIPELLLLFSLSLWTGSALSLAMLVPSLLGLGLIFLYTYKKIR